MQKNALVKAALLFFGLALSLLLTTSVALAKVEMNAMCFMKQNEATPQPFNPTNEEINNDPILQKNPVHVTPLEISTKYRLASLSKIITSDWALAQLGPEYRFKTKIHVSHGTKPANCNLHFEGDMDPYMGREMLTRIFTKLKPKLAAQNCHFIENISYDQFFPVFLDVMEHQKNPSQGWQDPAVYFNSNKTKKDFSAFIKFKSGLKGNFNNIGLVAKDHYNEYLRLISPKTYSVQSRPLYMILKDFNKYSFNYPPDVIFEKLGGSESYKKFVAEQLNLTANDIEMYNGSGYPLYISEDKQYNLVSCSALVRILQDLDNMLATYKGFHHFQLADVMATGGPGETYSTFKGLYSSSTYENTLVGKTGSAEKAITFGGMLSTTNGNLFFAVLTSPDSYDDSNTSNARILIRSLVQTLAERQVLAPFTYRQIGDMLAIDDHANLISEPGAKISAPLR